MKPSQMQVFPPTDWQQFERMMADLFEAEWGARAYLNGRTGQPQAGVDIYGKPDDAGRHHGLQCKRRDAYADKTITSKELTAEASSARSFQPGLCKLSLLVTGPRDIKLQTAARKLDKASRANKSFAIEVLFWDDILRIYDRHPDVYARHYDQHGRAKRRPNNLPFPPNPHFTGREAMMADLAARLPSASSDAVITQPQAVHGLGGVGKTQLAVEYAWANRPRYDALLWAVADSPTNLSANLAALASDALLDLPQREANDQSVAVAAVLRWLRDNPRWLLILDSVDSPQAAEAVCKLLSPPLGGHVIITTRRQTDWPLTVRTVNVDVLSDPAAADFLCGRVAGHAPGPRADAEALARDLGGLPLALEQAAAYIVRNCITFAQYRQLLATQRPEVLAAGTPGGTGCEYSVAETWLLSEQQLSLPARTLLRLMAFFAPDAIPRAMVGRLRWILRDPLAKDGTEGCPEAEASQHEVQAPDADAALVELHDYSLVGLTPESVSCHRLLQAVQRDRMSSDEWRQTALAALQLIDESIVPGPDDTRSWPVWTPLAPHLQAAATLADESGITEPTATLMNELALYYLARAQHGPAEPLMRRALEIDEKSFGPEHPEVATDLNNLAALLQVTNRLGEAEPLMRRALEIGEKAFGQEHPSVAIRLNNLAQLLQDTNRLAEAEPLMLRALEIDEKFLGPEHPHVATVLNNLAQLLKDTNRLAEAEPLMLRALEIDEKFFGPEHPHVATVLNNLGRLLQDTNRLAEAEPLVLRALKIDEKSFGPEHPEVAKDLNNLALLLQTTNRLAEAEPLVLRALKIVEKSFGPEHPHVAGCLGNLAQLLQDTNRLAEAEPLMRRALKIDEKSFGLEHPAVARDLNNLAGLLWATNRLAEAEPLMRRNVLILAKFRQVTGHEHPHAPAAEGNYRGLLVAMGLEEAEVGRRVTEAIGGAMPGLGRAGDIGRPPAEP